MVKSLLKIYSDLEEILKIYSVTYGTIDASVIVNFLSYNLLTDFLLWESHKKKQKQKGSVIK